MTRVGECFLIEFEEVKPIPHEHGHLIVQSVHCCRQMVQISNVGVLYYTVRYGELSLANISIEVNYKPPVSFSVLIITNIWITFFHFVDSVHILSDIR